MKTACFSILAAFGLFLAEPAVVFAQFGGGARSPRQVQNISIGGSSGPQNSYPSGFSKSPGGHPATPTYGKHVVQPPQGVIGTSQGFLTQPPRPQFPAQTSFIPRPTIYTPPVYQWPVYQPPAPQFNFPQQFNHPQVNVDPRPFNPPVEQTVVAPAPNELPKNAPPSRDPEPDSGKGYSGSYKSFNLGPMPAPNNNKPQMNLASLSPSAVETAGGVVESQVEDAIEEIEDTINDLEKSFPNDSSVDELKDLVDEAKKAFALGEPLDEDWSDKVKDVVDSTKKKINSLTQGTGGSSNGSNGSGSTGGGSNNTGSNNGGSNNGGSNNGGSNNGGSNSGGSNNGASNDGGSNNGASNDGGPNNSASNDGGPNNSASNNGGSNNGGSNNGGGSGGKGNPVGNPQSELVKLETLLDKLPGLLKVNSILEKALTVTPAPPTIPVGITPVVVMPVLPVGKIYMVPGGALMVGSGGLGEIQVVSVDSAAVLGVSLGVGPALPDVSGSESKWIRGGVVLRNPAENELPIKYTLALKRSFELMPGETQHLTNDAQRMIRFSRGEGLGVAAYELDEGTYSFEPTDSGWELFRESFSVTIDNAENDADFHYVLDNRPMVVAAGAGKTHESIYPMLVRFDRGAGGKAALKRIEEAEAYLAVAVNPKDGLWDLFPAGSPPEATNEVALDNPPTKTPKKTVTIDRKEELLAVLGISEN